MELKHYINNREIDEPVGFDSLKMVMKRGEYHGMSAEVSEQTLEFYGKAADMIHDAYNTDIDTELRYIVMADETEVYNGVIDLSTYEEQRSQYYSVSCKVGEVGVKTTFNNRTKTEVDLNSAKTVDGESVVLTSWENIKIPRKSLLYTNKGEWKKDELIIDVSGKQSGTLIETYPIPDKIKVDEFGSFAQDLVLFDKDDEFEDKYGTNTQITIDTTLNIQVDIATNVDTAAVAGHISIYVYLFVDGKLAKGRAFEEVTKGNTYIANINETVSTGKITLMIRVNAINTGEHGSLTFSCKASVLSGSYCTMTMWDNLQTDSVFAKMKLVCNVLADIIRKISENQLRLASDWYGLARMEAVGVTGKGFGGGALKAITNGYKIRGLFEDENGEKRSMPISFEKAVKSLDMLDCIGWGFSEENGLTIVRVERWNWFYKDAVVMRISSPNEIKREIDADKYYNEFSIGYKKYETSENYNSIDTYHGERTFVSPMKSIANAKEVSCDFIADNYAIEETRRARFQVDASEEFKYDENLFVFELSAKTAAITNVITGYSVVNNLTSSEGVQRPTEQINVQLSPRRCAARWNSFLHRLNNRRALAFSAGKNNCEAVLQCNVTGGSVIQARTNYLEDFRGGEAMKENQEMAYIAPLFKAETLSFKYPLTIEQYKAIKANPYGLIEVDGIPGWIKEFTYTFNTGEAEFKLIPKA